MDWDEVWADYQSFFEQLGYDKYSARREAYARAAGWSADTSRPLEQAVDEWKEEVVTRWGSEV